MGNQGHYANQVEEVGEDIGKVGELQEIEIRIDFVIYLQLIDGHPGVRGESLEHWHQELQATRPMANEQHDADEVEDPEEHAEGAQKLVETRSSWCLNDRGDCC